MGDYSQIWKLSITGKSKIVVILLFTFLFLTSCDNTGRENYENSKRIEIGMDEKQVVEIMGKPVSIRDSVGHLFVEPTVKLYYYTPPYLHFFSDGISIGFDINDKVSLIARGKSDFETKEGKFTRN